MLQKNGRCTLPLIIDMLIRRRLKKSDLNNHSKISCIYENNKKILINILTVNTASFEILLFFLSSDKHFTSSRRLFKTEHVYKCF